MLCQIQDIQRKVRQTVGDTQHCQGEIERMQAEKTALAQQQLDLGDGSHHHHSNHNSHHHHYHHHSSMQCWRSYNSRRLRCRSKSAN